MTHNDEGCLALRRLDLGGFLQLVEIRRPGLGDGVGHHRFLEIVFDFLVDRGLGGTHVLDEYNVEAEVGLQDVRDAAFFQ